MGEGVRRDETHGEESGMREDFAHIVDTKTFWSVMSDPRALRRSLMSAQIGERLYVCFRPPEMVEGFLNRTRAEAISSLAPRTMEVSFLSAWVRAMLRAWKGALR